MARRAVSLRPLSFVAATNCRICGTLSKYNNRFLERKTASVGLHSTADTAHVTSRYCVRLTGVGDYINKHSVSCVYMHCDTLTTDSEISQFHEVIQLSILFSLTFLSKSSSLALRRSEHYRYVFFYPTELLQWVCVD